MRAVVLQSRKSTGGGGALPGGTCFILENKSRNHRVELCSSSDGGAEVPGHTSGVWKDIQASLRARPGQGEARAGDFKVPFQLSLKQQPQDVFHTTQLTCWGYKDGERGSSWLKLEQLKAPCCPPSQTGSAHRAAQLRAAQLRAADRAGSPPLPAATTSPGPTLTGPWLGHVPASEPTSVASRIGCWPPEESRGSRVVGTGSHGCQIRYRLPN